MKKQIKKRTINSFKNKEIVINKKQMQKVLGGLSTVEYIIIL